MILKKINSLLVLVFLSSFAFSQKSEISIEEVIDSLSNSTYIKKLVSDDPKMKILIDSTLVWYSSKEKSKQCKVLKIYKTISCYTDASISESLSSNVYSFFQQAPIDFLKFLKEENAECLESLFLNELCLSIGVTERLKSKRDVDVLLRNKTAQWKRGRKYVESIISKFNKIQCD